MDDQDLNVQCDVFEDALTEDEDEMEKLYGGVDMSSHQHVFAALLAKVSSSSPRSTSARHGEELQARGKSCRRGGGVRGEWEGLQEKGRSFR